MRSIRISAVVLGFLYALFLVWLLVSQDRLPERIATHFGSGGAPDGWMSRTSHCRFMLTFGLLFPLAVPAVCHCVRFLPDSLINIPRREFWLATERRPQTMNYLFGHALWFACLAVCFVAGSHLLVVDANLRNPPSLSVPLLWAVAGSFVTGLAVWIAILLFRFLRLPK